MSRKVQKKRSFWQSVGRFTPYLMVFLMIFGIAKLGTEQKAAASDSSLNMNTIKDNNYSVSADQLSELYVVASLSSSFDLASVDTVSSNYVTVSVMKEIGQTTSDRLDKTLSFTGESTGVISYAVQEGDTIESIARKHGITVDQIRWSNGLKTAEVSTGQILALPSVAGVVYTVKAGESLESIAQRYGSSYDRIVARNDLETGDIREGMQIVLPGGTPPETERPEYVPPRRGSTTRPSTSGSHYAYSYYGSTSDRQNVRVVSDPVNSNYGNKFARGQCTWYAYWWRATNPRSQGKLPDNLRGNANVWAANARALGLRVDRNPEVGAVFQTPNGSYYGHVGVVLAINGDGSLLVREMNYGFRAYVITESIIPANIAGNFNYIH